MKLNRNNYEEYFILYTDNELGKEDRRAVEIFAHENPDLKAELEILMQSRLVPDADVTFTNKELLMIRNSSSISLDNYEEWLLTYTDNELTEGERKDVERFADSNPAIQKELDVLQQTRLQPEAIAFPYKDTLYRREEKAPVVGMRWWKLAAAAVLLAGISTTAIVLLNNKSGREEPGITNSKPETVIPVNNDVVKQPEKMPTPKQEDIITNIPQKRETAINRNNKTVDKEKKQQAVRLKKDEPVIVEIDKDKRKTNDLPKPIDNPNVKKDDESDVIVKTDKPSDKSPLTKPLENSEPDGVTHPSGDTYSKGDMSDKQLGNKDAVYASEKSGSGQKGGLRGFLRKVTRTIEKRTNIKATDEDDRLLIAGLAIKLN